MDPNWVTGILDPVILKYSKVSLLRMLLNCQDAEKYIKVVVVALGCFLVTIEIILLYFLWVCNWTGTSQPSPLSFFLLVFKVKVYMQLKWIQLSVPKLRISRLLQKTVELKFLVDKIFLLSKFKFCWITTFMEIRICNWNIS